MTEYDPRDVESLEAKAAAKGCKVVYPADDELQLDLDTEEAWHHFCGAFKKFQELEGVPGINRWRMYDSASGTGRHVVLRLETPEDLVTRILMQALLGSDLTRERLNFARVRLGMDNPIVLFEPLHYNE